MQSGGERGNRQWLEVTTFAFQSTVWNPERGASHWPEIGPGRIRRSRRDLGVFIKLRFGISDPPCRWTCSFVSIKRFLLWHIETWAYFPLSSLCFIVYLC